MRLFRQLYNVFDLHVPSNTVLCDVYVCPCLCFISCSEFTIHRTQLKQGESGFVRCIVKRMGQRRLPITDLGTEEMRIIYSSGFTIGEKYVCTYMYGMYTTNTHIGFCFFISQNSIQQTCTLNMVGFFSISQYKMR